MKRSFLFSAVGLALLLVAVVGCRSGLANQGRKLPCCHALEDHGRARRGLWQLRNEYAFAVEQPSGEGRSVLGLERLPGRFAWRSGSTFQRGTIQYRQRSGHRSADHSSQPGIRPNSVRTGISKTELCRLCRTRRCSSQSGSNGAVVAQKGSQYMSCDRRAQPGKILSRPPLSRQT